MTGTRTKDYFVIESSHTVAVQSDTKIGHGTKWLFEYLNMCVLLGGSKGLLIAWLYLS
jgi:hypothetical protein